jgi:hypothetical protein
MQLVVEPADRLEVAEAGHTEHEAILGPSSRWSAVFSMPPILSTDAFARGVSSKWCFP